MPLEFFHLNASLVECSGEYIEHDDPEQNQPDGKRWHGQSDPLFGLSAETIGCEEDNLSEVIKSLWADRLEISIPRIERERHAERLEFPRSRRLFWPLPQEFDQTLCSIRVVRVPAESQQRLQYPQIL